MNQIPWSISDSLSQHLCHWYSFGCTLTPFKCCELRWLISFHSFGDNHLRAVWRISLGLGVIPALVVFLWRLNMDEPERFKKDSMRDTKIPYLLVFKRYWVSLLAISFTWYVPREYSLRTLAKNPCSGSSMISLCECAVGPKPLRYWFGYWNTAIPFVPSFSTYLVAEVLEQFGIYSSTIVDRQVLQVFQTCMFIHNAFSVTGGSQSLAVVFGWSVVIKYVFPELVVLDFVEQFTACSISRAGHILLGQPVSLISHVVRNAWWCLYPRLSGSQVHHGQY